MALLHLAAFHYRPLPRDDIVRGADVYEHGDVGSVQLAVYPAGQVAPYERDLAVDLGRIVQEEERTVSGEMGDPAREHDGGCGPLRHPVGHVDDAVLEDYRMLHETRCERPADEHPELRGRRGHVVHHDESLRLQILHVAYVREHPADHNRLARMPRLHLGHGREVEDVQVRDLLEYCVFGQRYNPITVQVAEQPRTGMLAELHHGALVPVPEDQRLRADVRPPTVHQGGYPLACQGHINILQGDVLAVHRTSMYEPI